MWLLFPCFLLCLVVVFVCSHLKIINKFVVGLYNWKCKERRTWGVFMLWQVFNVFKDFYSHWHVYDIYGKDQIVIIITPTKNSQLKTFSFGTYGWRALRLFANRSDNKFLVVMRKIISGTIKIPMAANLQSPKIILKMKNDFWWCQNKIVIIIITLNLSFSLPYGIMGTPF